MPALSALMHSLMGDGVDKCHKILPTVIVIAVSNIPWRPVLRENMPFRWTLTFFATHKMVLYRNTNAELPHYFMLLSFF